MLLQMYPLAVKRHKGVMKTMRLAFHAHGSREYLLVASTRFGMIYVPFSRLLSQGQYRIYDPCSRDHGLSERLIKRMFCFAICWFYQSFGSLFGGYSVWPGRYPTYFNPL